VGVVADVAFEEPGREFIAEQAGAGLALEEGDEVILLGVGEHAFKSVVGGGEPLLPQLFPVRGGRRGHGRHGCVTHGWKRSGASFVSSHATRSGDAQLRNCTRPLAPYFSGVRIA
jgi:hypothetical protein